MLFIVHALYQDTPAEWLKLPLEIDLCPKKTTLKTVAYVWHSSLPSATLFSNMLSHNSYKEAQTGLAHAR